MRANLVRLRALVERCETASAIRRSSAVVTSADGISGAELRANLAALPRGTRVLVLRIKPEPSAELLAQYAAGRAAWTASEPTRPPEPERPKAQGMSSARAG